MKPRIEIFKDTAGQWRFRVRAGNGQIVAQSEGYTTKRGASKGVRALKRAVDGADGIKPEGGKP